LKINTNVGFAMKRIFKLILLIVVLIAAILVVFRALAFFRESESATTLSPPNGHFVQTSFGPVHFSQWGSATSPVVVMTHGMAAWGGLWTETAEHLSAHGFRVIAFDQAPFGFSDATNEDFSLFSEASRIGQALSSLGIHDAKLVGHSFGGGVAIETALQFPQLFNGMVLVCPVTKLGNSDGAQKASAPWLLRQTWMTEFLVSATITNPLMTKFLLQKFMAKKDMATAEEIRILQMPMRRRGNTHAMAIWLRQFFESDKNALTARADAGRALKMPVSFIWGAEDQVVSLQEADRLKTLVQSYRLDVLPAIGHMPQLEAPDAFQTLLLEQLNATQPKSLPAP
jgi:pimeloyl-ACP methyl ester carboxylesterase